MERAFGSTGHSRVPANFMALRHIIGTNLTLSFCRPVQGHTTAGIAAFGRTRASRPFLFATSAVLHPVAKEVLLGWCVFPRLVIDGFSPAVIQTSRHHNQTDGQQTQLDQGGVHVCWMKSRDYWWVYIPHSATQKGLSLWRGRSWLNLSDRFN